MWAAILFLAMVPRATAQSVPRNRLTFSGGWSREFKRRFVYEQRTATGFGFSYGRRLQKHVEAEAGVFTAMNPTGEICFTGGCVDVNDRFIWVPFGLRFIAPPYLGRIELSGGGGGLYQKYTREHDPVGAIFPYNGWGGYFVGSVSVAIDRRQRYWLGATPRWFLANLGSRRDRWFQVSGEFSLRFR